MNRAERGLLEHADMTTRPRPALPTTSLRTLRLAALSMAIPIVAAASGACTSGASEDASIDSANLSSGGPPAASNVIRVVRATYGGNEGAIDGNVTRKVATDCDGQPSCTYAIDALKLFPPAPACAPFLDIGGCDPAGTCADPFCSYLAKAREKGVMPAPTGCTTGLCPAAGVNRLEAASYIVRAKWPAGFTSSQSPYFSDVPSTSPFFRYVQKLKEAKITSGCTAQTFCGDERVTRGQMAVFLMRALYDEANDGAPRFAASGKPFFDDVPPGHPFFRFVQQLASLGITSGCDARRFCPDDGITKGQAATLAMRTFFPDEVAKGRPFGGRPLRFDVEYTCTDGKTYSASVPEEASGRSVTFSCPVVAPPQPCVEDAATTAFRTCLGRNGSGPTCMLPSGSHLVCSKIPIERTDIRTITGAQPGLAPSILVRGAAAASFLVRADAPIHDVTIERLVFDGNRYGRDLFGQDLGLNCLPANAPFYDLDFGDAAARVTAQWLEFINAPGTALVVGGTGSTIQFSRFGQGAPGMAPERTATRSTALWLFGQGSSARYNAISYAGTAAITIAGDDASVIGNWLRGNRYEISDGSGGGQLTLYPSSRNAYVAGNVIDGLGWQPAASQTLPTGCTAPPEVQENGGIEAYGTGHGFYNNRIVNHPSSAIGFGGIAPGGQLVFSSDNPRDPSDAEERPRYIEDNAYGIDFLGRRSLASFVDSDGPCTGGCLVRGVRFDGLLLRRQRAYGVRLESVVDDGAFVGFVNGGCISDNHPNVLDANDASEHLTSKAPPPASWRGRPCPAVGALVPSASRDPRWAW
ncbi:MAG: S-layer homology domain-containing protein [Deltaproteobacteria bacterium]|nr:S-layer homology domain-containing protein [Deltaproteobacteria bacterium]